MVWSSINMAGIAAVVLLVAGLVTMVRNGTRVAGRNINLWARKYEGFQET